MSEYLLQCDRIHKGFSGVPVLRDVSLSLPAGRVLGLVGENGAGKSTLMNVLGGIHQPDSGRVLLGGGPYSPRNPSEASRAGIAFVHQELNLFPNLTVAENIFLTGFPSRRILGIPFLDRSRIRKRTAELLALVDLHAAPDTPVEDLSLGERQLVEIAKALHHDARLIIFDEPTTSLTRREAGRLFDLIAKLRAQGISVIYISHALDDVLQLCDDIVVLRDGQVVSAGARSEYGIESLVTQMVGRTIDQLYPAREGARSMDVLLEVRAISEPGIVENISFALRKGEVLGISGLMGSGRSELARILFGLDPHARGDVYLDGRSITGLAPRERVALGIAYLTENRREDGLMMEESISRNVGLAGLRTFTRSGLKLIGEDALHRDVARVSGEVRLSAAGDDTQPVSSLSGGNQQKVVLGKWLLTRPSMFILDEPTRGIDVGAKHEIYRIMNRLADGGAGLLVISSEIEELLGLCDRILVMSRGEITGEFERRAFDREAILRAAVGGSRVEEARP